MFFYFLAAFVLWAMGHSLTASARLKAWVSDWVGQKRYEAYYRLGYNVWALVSLLPVLYAAMLLPHDVLWSVPRPWSWLMLIGVGLGGGGAIYSLYQTDVWSFLGIRQVVSHWLGRDEAPSAPQLTETLVVSGLYAYVRHPLYTFSMMVLWLNPQMTRSSLLLTAVFTLYFFIGSLFEERRLAQRFGAAYRDYQTRVPRFLPRLKFT